MSSELRKVNEAGPPIVVNAGTEDTTLEQKRTEVGFIPKDWDFDRIDKHALVKTGSRNTQDRTDDGQYPFFVRSQQVERIDTYSYDGEAVLTAGDGVGTGKVFHYVNGRFDVHQRVYRISDFSNRLHGRYFFYQFSKRFYDRIMSMTAKSSVDSVRMEMIAGMEIPIPPVPEQRAIADALSDVDGLLMALEALIAKKQDIKQAAMQLLLTGKARLPGFSARSGERTVSPKFKQTEVGMIPEDWDVLPLRELCSRIVDGTHHTPRYVPDGVPFYSVENISSDDFENVKYISRSEHDLLSRRCKPERGDILLTRIGSLGDTKLIDWNVEASIYVSLALLKIREEVDPQYINHYAKGGQFVRDVERRSLVNASPKKINMGNIGEIPIVVPNLIAEQRSIATVLSDMDAEIAALEARREKIRAIKQGMMQQLLTGRVRLVEPEAVI